MRQRNVGGRFNQRHDVDNIFEGMAHDLQAYEGQVVLWYMFDREASVVDPIYDVGSQSSGGTGREWKAPITVPALSVIRTEGAEQDQERGSYTTDSVHVVLSYEQAVRVGMVNLDRFADRRLNDRFVWNGVVYSPTRVQARGLVRHQHTVVGVDALQVNSEELVNDADFVLYALRAQPSLLSTESEPAASDPVASDPLYGEA